MRDIVSPLDGFRSPFGQMGSFFPAQLFRNGRAGYTITATPTNTYSDTGKTTLAAPGDLLAAAVAPVSGMPDVVQSSAPDRPVFVRRPANGVRNRFDNANDMLADTWEVIGGTRTGATIPGPAIGSTGVPIEVTTTGSFSGRLQPTPQPTFLAPNEPGHVYFDAKAGATDFARITFAATSGKNFRASFDLANGVIGDTQVSSGVDASLHTITPLGDGWYRCACGGLPGGTDQWASAFVHATDSGSTNEATAGNMIYVARAQSASGLVIEPFQNRISAFDITQTGVRSVYRWAANGVNQWAATASAVDMSGATSRVIIAGITDLGGNATRRFITQGSAAGAAEILKNVSDRWRGIYNDGAVRAVDGTVTPRAAVVELFIERSGNAELLINGVSQGTVAVGSQAFDNDPLSLFGNITGGALVNAEISGVTDLADPTPAERARLRAYHAYQHGEITL